MLDTEQARLYELIWTRTVASQMESAELERTTVDIEAKAGGRTIDLRATGQVVRFDGFLKLYQEGKDDDRTTRNPAACRRWPQANPARETRSRRRSISPSRRRAITEATLVKRMEELGIGRPSTYASTLAVLRDRDYVKLDKKRLVPEDKGRLVIAFLESFFQRYVEYDFTAGLEEQLDRVSNSEVDWKQVLRDFWRDFSAAHRRDQGPAHDAGAGRLNDLLGPHIFPAKADGGDPRACPSCGAGQLSLKIGKFGAFIGCSNYPECRFTRTLSPDRGERRIANGERPGVKVLGADPETGAEVTVRDGRFGAYIQLGERARATKPKRSSLPKGLKRRRRHARKGARTARRCRAKSRSIRTAASRSSPASAATVLTSSTARPTPTSAATTTCSRSAPIAPSTSSCRRNPARAVSAAAATTRELGEHPEGGAVAIKAGRFGPYVNWGKVNATLPQGTGPRGADARRGAGDHQDQAGDRRRRQRSRCSANIPTAARSSCATAASAPMSPGARSTPPCRRGCRRETGWRRRSG